MQSKNYPKAIEKLKVFRERNEFQNIPDLSDRALLRLGQAYAEVKQWQPSREVLENMVNRFGNSPWVKEARYGIAWTHQNQGQYDQAIYWYTQITDRDLSELSAKAQLQIGLSRKAQKRWGDAVTAFLVIPYTFPFPDLNAAALLEASRCLIEEKKGEQAEKLLQKLIKEYPNTDWAKFANELLPTLKK